MTEAHAKLSVVRNCSISSLFVCLGEGKQLAGGGWSAVAGGGGRRGEARQYTGRENLEQFPTTESWAWASVINLYSMHNPKDSITGPAVFGATHEKELRNQHRLQKRFRMYMKGIEILKVFNSSCTFWIGVYSRLFRTGIFQFLEPFGYCVQNCSK